VNDRRHAVITGLGYGDEGKGTITEWYVRKLRSKVVVRYNGGAQCAHNVVTSDGRHHTFAQFGCGTFAGAATHLSRHVLVNPATLFREAGVLEEKGVREPLKLLSIEQGALVTTHFHVIANRIRERARGADRHGSCGMGIGETAEDALAHPEDAIRVEDGGDLPRLRRKVERLAARKHTEVHALSSVEPGLWDMLHDCFTTERTIRAVRALWEHVAIVDESFLHKALREGPVVFEGAQGALLDEDYGFHPYTTWSDTTPGNALGLLQMAGLPDEDAHVIGVTRAYGTRHGAGPFVTEDAACQYFVTEDHNKTGEWQGNFRAGWLDLPALRYACQVAHSPDAIAVTNLDAFDTSPVKLMPVCTSYHMPNPDPNLFVVEPRIGGGNVRGIRYFFVETLERRQRVGAALATATPAYSYVAEEAKLLRYIEGACEAPVAVISRGPRFEDKAER
jgi:adenylosuccinate synthase